MELPRAAGITAVFTPSDLALYRSLLPKQFDMPEAPLVAVAIVNYYDVTLPLTPYHEGYVVLQCQYQGQTGWYVLTMPVDDATANLGGRALGFPKYIADKIVLDEGLGSWSGGVSHQGRIVMGVGFAPDGNEPVTASSGDPGLPIFLLVPPAEGPQINQIGMDLVGERQTVTTSGTATVYADPGEPWAGLLPAKGTAVFGQLQVMTGDWCSRRNSARRGRPWSRAVGRALLLPAPGRRHARDEQYRRRPGRTSPGTAPAARAR